MSRVWNVNFLTTPKLDGTHLGGGIQGVSPVQSVLNYKDGENTLQRKVLVKSWNTAYATGTVNGYKRVTTPFRAVNNSGDFLARQNYNCGGANQVNASRPGYGRNIRHANSICDLTGVPASNCNVRWGADSSDYVRFRKQQASNRNYNDRTFGGDGHTNMVGNYFNNVRTMTVLPA